MGKIRELDYSTVVRIAAGEVIDRPASVVRELLDNAIDAGARNIDVSIAEGGIHAIEVSDDGSGMSRDDLEICYRNHTTSKITGYGDIEQLETLGFRGEALASIAETAALSVISRPAAELSAYNMTVLEGKRKDLREEPRNPGTTVKVNGLFRNMPARLKFLSSPAAETRLVNREIIRKALGFPGVGFSFSVDGKRKYLSPARPGTLERIRDFFPDAADSLVPVYNETEGVLAEGFISRPDFFKNNRSYQYLFVNNRPVEWKNFFFALQNAYGSLVPKGFYPAVFVYITINPGLADFNVHPMKREVRFKDEHSMQRLLQDTVRGGLQKLAGYTGEVPDAVPLNGFENRVAVSIRDFMSGNTAGNGIYNRVPEYNRTTEHQPGLDFNTGGNSGISSSNGKGHLPFMDYRFAGVLFQTYILLEGPDEVTVMDQHAAHERITYEKLRAQYREKLLTAVELLIPARISVPEDMSSVMHESLDVLKALGFELEPFGGLEYLVRTVPPYIDAHDAGECVLAYLSSAAQGSDAHVSDSIDASLKQMACKSSVRSGDKIGWPEVRAILEALNNTEEPFSCPHGRPVFWSMARREIEQRFRRLGFI